jgi:hypothetical protein
LVLLWLWNKPFFFCLGRWFLFWLKCSHQVPNVFPQYHRTFISSNRYNNNRYHHHFYAISWLDFLNFQHKSADLFFFFQNIRQNDKVILYISSTWAAFFFFWVAFFQQIRVKKIWLSPMCSQSNSQCFLQDVPNNTKLLIPYAFAQSCPLFFTYRYSWANTKALQLPIQNLPILKSLQSVIYFFYWEGPIIAKK